jgi:Short C-terminal domain
MSLADELQKLEDLRRSGALSEQEFRQAKAALLGGAGEAGEQLAEMRYQNELARIDREWQIEREQYMVADRWGRMHVPTPEGSRLLGSVGRGSMIGGLMAVVVGTLWTAFAIFLTEGAPAPLRIIFPLFGVCFILFGLLGSIGFHRFAEQAQRMYEEKAAQYQQAFDAYQQRRQEAARRYGFPEPPRPEHRGDEIFVRDRGDRP